MVGSDALLPPSHAALSCREVIPDLEGGEPTSFILHHSRCVLVLVGGVGCGGGAAGGGVCVPFLYHSIALLDRSREISVLLFGGAAVRNVSPICQAKS